MLDNSPIIYSIDGERNLHSSSILNINQLRAQRRTLLSSPPEGTTASDYNDFLEEVRHKVTFGEKMIKNLTVAAFTSALALLLFGSGGSSIAGAVFGSIYSSAKSMCPENNYLSYINVKNRKLYVGKYTVVVKNVTEYFSHQDYSHSIGKSTFYEAYES